MHAGGMDMVRELDDITFTEWFMGKGGSRGSIERMWDPIAYALGFLDCDHISARCVRTCKSCTVKSSLLL